LEALGGIKTINQSAQEHDVHPMQVRQWKRDIQAQAKTLFEGKRGPKPVSPASSPDRRSFCFSLQFVPVWIRVLA
jgi:transposase